jgi:hypothetical protein
MEFSLLQKGHCALKLKANVVGAGFCVGLLFLTSCAGGDLTGAGGEKKEAKQRKTTAETSNENSSQEQQASQEASQPQVVTGAYLACVQTDNANAKSGEAAYGCGVYDEKTDTKMKLSSNLNLKAKSSSGSEIATRTVPESENSPFHAQVFVPAASASDMVITGDMGGATLTGGRVVSVRNIQDGFALKNRYNTEEITRWCGVATLLPQDASSFHRSLVKGTACGSDYLSSNGSPANFVTKILSGLSNVAGSNQLANAGVCEQPGVTTNTTTNIARCSNK